MKTEFDRLLLELKKELKGEDDSGLSVPAFFFSPDYIPKSALNVDAKPVKKCASTKRKGPGGVNTASAPRAHSRGAKRAKLMDAPTPLSSTPLSTEGELNDLCAWEEDDADSPSFETSPAPGVDDTAELFTGSEVLKSI